LATRDKADYEGAESKAAVHVNREHRQRDTNDEIGDKDQCDDR